MMYKVVATIVAALGLILVGAVGMNTLAVMARVNGDDIYAMYQVTE